MRSNLVLNKFFLYEAHNRKTSRLLYRKGSKLLLRFLWVQLIELKSLSIEKIDFNVLQFLAMATVIKPFQHPISNADIILLFPGSNSFCVKISAIKTVSIVGPKTSMSLRLSI